MSIFLRFLGIWILPPPILPPRTFTTPYLHPSSSPFKHLHLLLGHYSLIISLSLGILSKIMQAGGSLPLCTILQGMRVGSFIVHSVVSESVIASEGETCLRQLGQRSLRMCNGHMQHSKNKGMKYIPFWYDGHTK